VMRVPATDRAGPARMRWRSERPERTIRVCPAAGNWTLVLCSRNQGFHGSTTVTPQPSKSVVLRVAMAAPRKRAIAAIWASKCEMGRPVRRRSDAIWAYGGAASVPNPRIRPPKSSANMDVAAASSALRRRLGGNLLLAVALPPWSTSSSWGSSGSEVQVVGAVRPEDPAGLLQGQASRAKEDEAPVAGQHAASLDLFLARHHAGSVQSSSRVISIIVRRKPRLAKSRCAGSFCSAVERTTRGAPRDFR
jgi:hypothetical protein